MIVKNASKAVAALAATLTLTTLLGCAHPPGSQTIDPAGIIHEAA